jgi:glycerophosphoryl diester phosphodiesterase
MPGRKSFIGELHCPLIIAHRGASVYAPENTLAAFKLAIDQQADGIELDAQLTDDGQVVVMHDDTLDRTTNGTGRIKSYSLAHLQSLDAGSKFSESFRDERVPSLAEVFEAVGQDTLINVELKNYTSPTDDLPDKVAALVKEFHLENSVLLSSFNMLALIRARRVLPHIQLGLLTFSGLADATMRFKIIRFSHTMVLHPNYEDVTPRLVQMAHKAKSRINTYTVKQPEIMRQMLAAGVDGIITPDPLMARAVLAENK